MSAPDVHTADPLTLIDLLTPLYGEYELGPCEGSNLKELVITILSHRTNKADETKAFNRMWSRFGSWQAIADAPLAELIGALAPVQFPERKAPYIQSALKRVFEERGEHSIDFLADMPADKALDWLLALPGVGIKTASLVMLFCFHQPVMPVDTHVHRVSGRVGILPQGMSAEKAHVYLLSVLPPDASVLYKYHRLLLKHGQTLCTFFTPKCHKCPVRPQCLYYQTIREGTESIGSDEG